MHVLFVHQNFPAQFRCIAPRLASEYGWTCTFVTRNASVPAPQGVRKVLYNLRFGAGPDSHVCTRRFENGVGHALGVYEALKARRELRPDLVVAHSGFGSSLFVPCLYDAPVVNFFEFYSAASDAEFGYRPELAVTEAKVLRSRTANAMTLHDLQACDRGWSPSFYQRDLFPSEYHSKIEVIPEGIDTDVYRPRTGAPRRLPDGTDIPDGTRLVTYVSRGLELARGFDLFMKAAKLIYHQFPDVLFVVVGTDRIAYGTAEQRAGFNSFRERVLAEGEYDLSRFCFTGRLPEPELAEVLSISDLHVYLTVPFVTSWSMLDAMSSGCVVLASSQTCTREYITHGRNGLLCEFFDVEGIANQAVKVLRDAGAFRALGAAARRTIEEGYSVNVCLPRIKAFFEEVAAKGPRSPSLRAEKIVRPAMSSPSVPDKSNGAASAARGEPTGTWPTYDGAVPFTTGAPRPVDVPSPESFPTSTRESGEGKTVLFCWELGGGLGHLMQMLPLAEDLARAGHHVFVALRHLEGATAIFGGAGVTFLQAPGRFAPARAKFPRPASFTQLLANMGFDDPLDLFATACAWRNLFKVVGPDLALFDHAPTALLASRGFDLKRALIGSGFCCPPDESPMPAFQPDLRGRSDVAMLLDFDEAVLSVVNGQLGRWGEAPLDRLGQLYSDVDENFLTTFPALDHYPARAAAGAAYWGPVIAGAVGGADPPEWPAAGGRRVFAYLKPFRDLPNVLHALADAGNATLVYVEGAPPGLRRRFESAALRFADGPLDLARVGSECDAAVLNAGHGVTAEMLLAGKPILQIPLALEQRLTADACRRIGAGEVASAASVDGVRAALDEVLDDGAYAAAARRFADRYAAFDPARQRPAMLARAEELLSTDASAPRVPLESSAEPQPVRSTVE